MDQADDAARLEVLYTEAFDVLVKDPWRDTFINTIRTHVKDEEAKSPTQALANVVYKLFFKVIEFNNVQHDVCAQKLINYIKIPITPEIRVAMDKRGLYLDADAYRYTILQWFILVPICMLTLRIVESFHC